MSDAERRVSMNVPTLVAIAFATFAVLAGTVALFGLGMDEAFSNQTPRLNPGIVALLSASGAALSFMLGILLLDIPGLAKAAIALVLLGVSAGLAFGAFLWTFVVH